MASTGFMKRQKELSRQEKQRAKSERNAERKKEKASRTPTEDGVDPDLVGIIPGPQPVQDED
jgi:hypothetical protein